MTDDAPIEEPVDVAEPETEDLPDEVRDGDVGEGEDQ